MVVKSVFLLLIVYESSKMLSNAFNTYCALPCPFTYPAQPPSNIGAIQLPPRRPNIITRSSFYDAYTDYEDIPEESQTQPPSPPPIRRRLHPVNQDQPAPPPSPPPKPKPKPPPEDSEPPPKKKAPSVPLSCPSIQPTRRFFTSLFSIPGAIVDTLISGEIVL